MHCCPLGVFLEVLLCCCISVCAPMLLSSSFTDAVASDLGLSPRLGLLVISREQENILCNYVGIM